MTRDEVIARLRAAGFHAAAKGAAQVVVFDPRQREASGEFTQYRDRAFVELAGQGWRVRTTEDVQCSDWPEVIERLGAYFTRSAR